MNLSTCHRIFYLLACYFLIATAWHQGPPATPPSNILLITMGGTKSHKIPFMALAKGLISKGHNVTFVSGFRPDSKTPGLTEVTPPLLVDFIVNFTLKYDLLRERLNGQIPVGFRLLLQYPPESCEALLSDPEAIDLLSQKFDLIVMDGAYPDCSFAYATQAPFMYLNTVGYLFEYIAISGSPSPFSVTPWPFRPTTERMTFWQRVVHFGVGIGMELTGPLFRYHVHRVLKSHLGNGIAYPGEIAKNVSFILQNGHFSLSAARPYLKNVAEIACIHCKPANPLPKSLEDFVTGSEAGFIYVSMGTSVNTATMPASLLATIVNALAQLAPYRVLWKFDGTFEAGQLPENVRVERWLPQQDLLGHPSIKAFVTHAGLLSMFETAYHGVPVVMLPVFCDQDSISAKAAADGYGLSLELSDLTTDKLVGAVRKLIDDPQYKTVAERVQRLIKDQEASPLEKAVYWTEYVLRHKGADHLKSPASGVKWYKYYMVDVAAFLALIVICLVALYRRLRGVSTGRAKKKVA